MGLSSEGRLDTDTHTGACRVKITVRELLEATGQAWNTSLPHASEGAWPCRHLDLELQASRTGREYTSVV